MMIVETTAKKRVNVAAQRRKKKKKRHLKIWFVHLLAHVIDAELMNYSLMTVPSHLSLKYILSSKRTLVPQKRRIASSRRSWQR
jgi:hypothetical protein